MKLNNKSHPPWRRHWHGLLCRFARLRFLGSQWVLRDVLRGLLLGVVVSLIFSGCAQTPQKTASRTSDVADVQSLNTYSVRGKIRIKEPTDSTSGNFLFYRNYDLVELTVSGPLGLGSRKFYGNRSNPTFVRDDKGNRINLNSQAIPDVVSLETWLLCDFGIVRPVADRESGIVQSRIQQNGRSWDITCDAWEAHGTVVLPSTIVGVSNTGDKVEIFLNKWRFAN